MHSNLILKLETKTNTHPRYVPFLLSYYYTGVSIEANNRQILPPPSQIIAAYFLH